MRPKKRFHLNVMIFEKKSSVNALRYDTQETKSGIIDIPASYILSFILQKIMIKKQSFMHIQVSTMTPNGNDL